MSITEPPGTEIQLPPPAVADSFRFVQVLKILIVGMPDSWDCKMFPLNIGFHYAQVPFEAGFTVRVI